MSTTRTRPTAWAAASSRGKADHRDSLLASSHNAMNLSVRSGAGSEGCRPSTTSTTARSRPRRSPRARSRRRQKTCHADAPQKVSTCECCRTARAKRTRAADVGGDLRAVSRPVRLPRRRRADRAAEPGDPYGTDRWIWPHSSGRLRSHPEHAKVLALVRSVYWRVHEAPAAAHVDPR